MAEQLRTLLREMSREERLRFLIKYARAHYRAYGKPKRDDRGYIMPTKRIKP